MGLIPEAKFENAVQEIKAALRGKSDAHVIEPGGARWHPAVVVSKQSLRVLLEVAKKAVVL
jgi:hypothetical protein